MTKLENINKDVNFKEDTHQYFKNGKELTAVSRVIDFYKNSFDSEGHILRACAKRDNLTVSQVRENWEKTKIEGLTRGKNFHRQVEHYIKTGQILDEDYKDVVEQFAQIKFSGKLFSEIGLHSDKYSMSGTTDGIHLISDNIVDCFDFKSNKKFLIKSKYGDRLMYPMEKYWNSEMDVYTIQLNLYSYMLGEHGYKTNNMTIYYINPTTRLLETYLVPHIQGDIIKLLNHYSAMMAW